MALRAFPVGTTVSETELKRQFGPNARDVLCDRLDPLPRAKRERAKFKVTKELPLTTADYEALEARRYTTTVEDLVEGAYAEIESLGEEMREAYENMPESLQQADIGQRRGEAADNLGACPNNG
jgi:hypothetical protein